MCIQDNPRYKRLVEMGMPPNTKILYSWEDRTCYYRTWLNGNDYVGGLGDTPEEAFDSMCNAIEKRYDVHQ